MLRGLSQIFVIGVWVLFSAPWALAGNGGSPAEGGTSSLVDQGRPLYLHYCAHCHGISGDGDGYNAEWLDKEPAELSDPQFIAKKKNSQIYRVIKFGGLGVKKSHLMPLFGHTLSEEEVWSLVAYVRHLAGDQDHPVTLPEGTSKTRPATPAHSYDSLTDFSEWFLKHGAEPDRIARGEKIFRKKKSCLACHQLEDEGGKMGPDLSRAGSSYTPEWIFTWTGNPQRIKPATPMPNLGLNNEECRTITAFLSSLRVKGIKKGWQDYLKTPGDPEIGKQLFFDDEGKANCGKCHSVNGRGGKVGPPLSFVGSSRTQGFLLESLLNPKAVITSGYSSILILTKEGKFITGVKVNEDESSIDLVNKEGNKLHISKREIKKFKAQKISIMPGNFKDILTTDEVRHLLAYLGTLKISN